MDRLTLWRSLPNYRKYMEYYRSKKRYCNIKRTQYYLEIKNDVKRTYLHCSFTEENEAQNSLISILAIYAMRNPDVGYVQGMNFLAGTLFLQCGFDSSSTTGVSDFSNLNSSIENQIRGGGLQHAHYHNGRLPTWRIVQ